MADFENAPGAFVEVDGTLVHYQSIGEGPPVLMIHGWPTSSHLWRNVLPVVGAGYKTLALDLPGYGWSDKPPGTRYSFGYYDRILEGFVETLGLSRVDLVVHDLGGPVGVLWALRHPERVRKLVLMNTLLFPEMSGMVKLFMLSLRIPGLRNFMSSHAGIRFSLRFGVVQKQRIRGDVLTGYQAPFVTRDAREGLLAGGRGLSVRGFYEIEEKLSQFRGPIRVVYGERDRILPDVGKTFARLKSIHPETTITALPDCGHFLQEDDPETVARTLKDFLDE